MSNDNENQPLNGNEYKKTYSHEQWEKRTRRAHFAKLVIGDEARAQLDRLGIDEKYVNLICEHADREQLAGRPRAGGKAHSRKRLLSRTGGGVDVRVSNKKFADLKNKAPDELGLGSPSELEKIRGVWVGLDASRKRVLKVVREAQKKEDTPPDNLDGNQSKLEFSGHAVTRMGQRGISRENVWQIFEHKDFDKPRGKGRRGWMIKKRKLAILERKKKLSKSDAERLNGVVVISMPLSPDRFKVITVHHHLESHRN